MRTAKGSPVSSWEGDCASVHLLHPRQGDALRPHSSCLAGPSSPKAKLLLLQTLPPAICTVPHSTFSALAQVPLSFLQAPRPLPSPLMPGVWGSLCHYTILSSR